MGVSDRWVRKLLQRMKRQGDAAVVHGLRGRASNRKIAAKLEAQAIEILKQPDWHDFGPTFAAEQLAKRHRIRWLITLSLARFSHSNLSRSSWLIAIRSILQPCGCQEELSVIMHLTNSLGRFKV
jgi:hypothetical protein